MVPDAEYFGYTEEEYATYLEERKGHLADYKEAVDKLKDTAKGNFEDY